MQHHAGLPRHDGRAKYAIKAMDQRHRIALRIYDRDIHGIAGQTAVRRDLIPRQGPSRIHQRATLIGMRLGDQPLHRHVGEQGVGQKAVAIVIRNLFSLHHQVGRICTEIRFLVQRKGLKQIEHLQNGKTLGRRGRLKNRDVAIRALKGLTPPSGLRR